MMNIVIYNTSWYYSAIAVCIQNDFTRVHKVLIKHFGISSASYHNITIDIITIIHVVVIMMM